MQVESMDSYQSLQKYLVSRVFYEKLIIIIIIIINKTDRLLLHTLYQLR